MTAAAAPPQLTVALLLWGNEVEDFIEPLGVPLAAFCTEFTGSWAFGYAAALRTAGVRTVLMCVSRGVSTPERFTHRPSQATVCVLPSSDAYRRLRQQAHDPYGRSVRDVFRVGRAAHLLCFPVLALLKEGLPYLATPPRALTRMLRDERCDVMLCQEYEYPRFDVCVLLGRLLRLPVFATFQGGDYHQGRSERYIRPWTLRAGAGVVVAPDAEARRVEARYGVPRARIARIVNPVDTAVWHPRERDGARAALGIPANARVAAWHGRVLVDPKGLDVLLAAWRRVCDERPDTELRLILVGNGGDAADVAARIAADAIPGVHWVRDFVHDRAVVSRLLGAADVYAFSSRHEGFPVAPLEAMACGLPVVAADASGIAEILAGGEAAGGVVVPRDDPAAFAHALGRLLDDEPLSRELGTRARRRVEASFSLEAVGRQLSAFLTTGRAGAPNEAGAVPAAVAR